MRSLHYRYVFPSLLAAHALSEVAAFSYLDSLSKANQPPPASELPTVTPEPTGEYLDSPANPSEGSAAVTVVEPQSGEEPANNNPMEWSGYFQRPQYGEILDNASYLTTDESSNSENDPTSTATAAAAATRSKFLEMYNTQNPFAGRKPSQPQIPPPTATTTEEASLATTTGEEEDLSEVQKLMKQVKEAGTAGVISYALWELGFWALSVPVCAFGYYQYTGHWPDLSDPEDQKKLGAEAFAFVNFARFAVPLRIGLALGTTPWIDENIVKRFSNQEEGEETTTTDEPM